VRGSAALLSARLILAGSLAGSIGCGLTADYSGLQDGAAGGLDASTPPELDATSDVSEAADGSALPDANAPDAADGGEGFCATLAAPVKLCADFDEGEPVDAGWGATDLYGGEAISVGTPAFSAPGAFQSAVNPSGAPSSARLLQAVPTLSPHVHVEFEILLVPSDGTFELGVIHEVTPDGTTYGLYFREVNSAFQVELRSLSDDGGVFDQYWPLGAPPAGWSRIDLDLTIADSGSFVIEQDGVTVLSETNLPTSTPSRSATFVELGFYSFTPGSGQASFDNATVDWQ
jgi:hypothetical protein